jgi:hypothetical protein
MAADDEHASVLVIRVWRESGAEPGDLRARLRQTLDVNASGWEESAAAGEESILAAVRSWLREVALSDAPEQRTATENHGTGSDADSNRDLRRDR